MPPWPVDWIWSANVSASTRSQPSRPRRSTKETGLIHLTTTLAHSSGEWMSSDWPVCPVSETAAPHRMGTALTYARRYALFTLVGIAGEDDLDAPDLAFQTKPLDTQKRPSVRENRPDGVGTRAAVRTLQEPRSQEPRKSAIGPKAEVLSAEASAVLRDDLLAELEGLEDDLDAWTLRAWPRANTLTSDDGDKVRRAFEARLARLPSTTNQDLSPTELVAPAANDETRSRIDKSVLALPEAKRLRDRQHLRFVAKQPCLVCGREPCDPHHLRFAQPRGLGQKVSDEFTRPAVPGPSQRTAPRRQGSGMVDTKGNRAVSHCPRAVAWHSSFAEASSAARMILRASPHTSDAKLWFFALIA